MGLREYGGRMLVTDGLPTVEMRDPNDGARARHQYRVGADGLERRVLQHDGSALDDGSPWTTYSEGELLLLRAACGTYHPILDSLGVP